jgi:hypothetical protein
MSHSELMLTWDQLRERSEVHTELTEAERCEAARAFTDLKRIFNDQFFDMRHPLFLFFFDRSGWRCEWATWFAGFLNSVSKHPDFPRLVRELQDPLLYGERMTVLYTVDILLSAGFSFSLDPEITVNGKPKKPDIFVQLNEQDRGFFIEVTSLSSSEKQREADAVFHTITNALLPFMAHLDYSGHLERILSPVHLQEILQKVQLAAKKAAGETGFETVEIEGVIRLALAAKSQRTLLDDWALARGLEPCSFLGPGADVSEISRISRTLKEEQIQLPADRANVVVIYSHFFTMPPRDEASFEQWVNRLEEEVFKYSHIGYLLLIFSWTGGNDSGVIQFRDHFCVNRRRFYFDCEAIMIFKNRFVATPMPSAVEVRFRDAFVQAGAVPIKQVNSEH